MHSSFSTPLRHPTGTVGRSKAPSFSALRGPAYTVSIILTPGRRQSKTLPTIVERGSKSIETVFSTDYVSNDFYLRSSIYWRFRLPPTRCDPAIEFYCHCESPKGPHKVLLSFIFNYNFPMCPLRKCEPFLVVPWVGLAV